MILERIDNEKVVDWYYPYLVDGRKSFYKKATVYETEKYFYLQSYSTLMCRYNKKTETIERLNDACSQTTCRHLRAFFNEMRSHISTKDFYKMSIYQEEVSDEFVENFKKDYDNLNPEVKKILANSDVIVHSKEEAEELMRISQLFSLLMD